MKFKNVWFDLTSFLCVLMMLACASGAIVRYLQGDGESIASVALVVVFFLLFALTYFRMSLQIGKYQEKARQRKKRY